MSGTNSLRDSKVGAVLDRLHAAAKGDVWHYAKLAPAFATALSISDGFQFAVYKV